MIDVLNLSVRLAGKTVVHDVSFTAKAGALTAI